MGWLTNLYGKTVGLDTAPIIYFIERHPKYLPLVYPFFKALQRGEINVVTSTLTLTEVLVHLYRRADGRLADQYSRVLLNTRNLETLPASSAIEIEAARLRAAHGLKTPDSIQLATAKIGGATSLLSNDSRIATIPGLGVILLDTL